MAPGGRQSKRKRSIVPTASTRVLQSSSARQHPVPEQFSPSAKNRSGGENVVQEGLATAADDTSCHENLNNPDGANGVNETETGRMVPPQRMVPALKVGCCVSLKCFRVVGF